MTTDTAPAYFGDAARAAWDEITAGCELHGTGDRLRAEQAALLLAELRAGPELFNASKHAQLRALLAELLPPTPQPDPAPEEELNRALGDLAKRLEREEQQKREERRAQREARKRTSAEGN